MRIDVLQEAESLPLSSTAIFTDRTYHVSVPSTYKSITKNSDFQHTTSTEDMPSCDDCGLVFENPRPSKTCEKMVFRKGEGKYDVSAMERDDSNVTPFKPEKNENDGSEHEVFNFLMTMAKEDNEKLCDQIYDKYIKEGLSREDTRVQTEEKMNAKDLKKFLEKYGQLILYNLPLQHGSLQGNVTDDVKEFMSKGYDERRAIRMTLNKNRPLLEEMFDR